MLDLIIIMCVQNKNAVPTNRSAVISNSREIGLDYRYPAIGQGFMLLDVIFYLEDPQVVPFIKLRVMQQLRFLFTASLLFFVVTNSHSQKNSTESSSVLGIFVASTPCSQGTRPLPGIPGTGDYELIKWKLTLYQDESGKTPTTFKLNCIYGMPQQGTTGFIGGGKSIEMDGKWTITHGRGSDPNAIVYRLSDTKTNQAISFLKLSNDLLHLLDSDQHLMIGNAAWSYTLNRIVNQ